MSSSHYAYEECWKDVEAVMRLHAVKRWHMIDTTRIQTLAEHTGNVALLVFAIAKTCPQMYFGSAAAIAGKAVVHDVAEVFTGDVPSHTKAHIGHSLDALEQSTMPPCFNERLDPNEKMLIKLADLADGIRFIRLHGVDVTSRHAREGLEVKFQDLIATCVVKWPAPVCHHATQYAHFYAYERS